MNKKTLTLCIALCFAAGLGYVRASYGWLFDAEANVNTNSNNQDQRNSRNNNSINMRDGRYFSSAYSNSFNSYNNQDYNQRYDNRRDASAHNSFNTTSTDNSDRSTNSTDNSYNDRRSYDYSTSEVLGGGKRVNSNDISVGGNVRNSVMGDFNQYYGGTDLRSGVTGSGNTIDAASTNITTFGDISK
jgi:hypothetical protein